MLTDINTKIIRITLEVTLEFSSKSFCYFNILIVAVFSISSTLVKMLRSNQTSISFPRFECMKRVT